MPMFKADYRVGVYDFPFPLGDHHKHPRQSVLEPGEIVEVYEFEVVHPNCAFVWRRLVDRNGWIIQRQRWAEIDFLSYHTTLDI